MSKSRYLIFRFLFGIASLAFLSMEISAQYLEASITVNPDSASATVSGKFDSAGERRLSFLLSDIGAPDLGRRISGVELKAANGRPVQFRAFGGAEYVAEGEFTNFSYEIDLFPLSNARSAAHVSWVGKDDGILFPDDLLPIPALNDEKRAAISFGLPDGWRAIGDSSRRPDGSFEVENVERSVFVVGKNIRTIAGAKGGFKVAVSGKWLFDDAEASNMADEVFGEYSRIFRVAPAKDSLVVLVPVPQSDAPKGTWEAETRGSTVVITSSDMAFKTQSQQRLHEQLRHEMFHLWLPNGVGLTGRYDWFYEGFALYQSLRTGVAVNRLRFDDLLDTVSRAYAIDRAQTDRRSLIEASDERWIGGETQVYARGMVVAFLCDILLFRSSKGKDSVEKLLATVYSKYSGGGAATDANTAILSLFEADPRIEPLAASYISGAKPIEWTSIISRAGLEADPRSLKLRVKPKLSGREKALLTKLGYNNWRKLIRK
ncbi:MAG: hypothetical protein AB7F88_15585 [Pyrinomonadaceae bacterium]